MDPLPSTNKAFALISPEEDQRKITSQVGCTSDPVGSMTFTVKSYNAKRPGIPNSGTIAMVVIEMIQQWRLQRIEERGTFLYPLQLPWPYG